MSGFSGGVVGGIIALVFQEIFSTHQFDALNQILKLGIPESAISTGGIYFYKDGRTVPDVLTTVFEYPKRDLSLIYSATLSSEVSRGTKIMGHDAYMEIGRNLSIYADRSSTKYKEKIKNKLIDPSVPVYSYIPGAKTVDAVTSATALYFAERGDYLALTGMVKKSILLIFI